MFVEIGVFHSVFKGVKGEINIIKFKSKTKQNLQSQRTCEMNYNNIGNIQHTKSVIHRRNPQVLQCNG